jgi:hypothetical protein
MTGDDDTAVEKRATALLSRLSNVLKGFDRNLNSVRAMHNNTPAAGSLKAREVAQEPPLATPDREHPVLDAYGIATIRMIAATDHLSVLASAIEAPPHLFAPQTLARQGIENAARAWHSLDPDIGPTERAARLATDHLLSLWENGRRGIKMTDGTDPAEIVARIRAWADQVRIPVHTTDQGRLWVGTKDRPSATAVIEEMMGELGKWGYHLHSEPSHGGLGGLASRLEPDPEAVDGIGASITVSTADIAMIASWVILGALEAFKRYFDVHGWTDDMTERWRLHAAKTSREAGEATGLFQPSDDNA